MVGSYDGENSHIGALNFYPIFIPLFECKVSGVSVQDMLLRQPFLTPDTCSFLKAYAAKLIRGTKTV